jgi:hypothetical protein
MGFLNKAHELTGDPSGRVLKNGVPGKATIKRATQTGLSSGVGKDPVVKFTLEVSIPGSAAYEVDHRQWVPRLVLSRAQPGCVVAVKVDPKDPGAIAIDWSAQAAADDGAPPASREYDFTGGPARPAGPELAPGAEAVEAQFGAQLAFDGKHVGVIQPGRDPVVAPLAAVQSIGLSEGDAGLGTAGHLFVKVSAAGVRLPALRFPPEGRAAAEAFVEKLRRSREAVDPADAAAAGGSG